MLLLMVGEGWVLRQSVSRPVLKGSSSSAKTDKQVVDVTIELDK